MNITSAVRRENHDGRSSRFECSNFRNSDLKVGENFKKVRLELIVSAVDFVDEQHRALAICLINRAKNGALQQKALVVQLAFQGLGASAACFATCFCGTKVQQLTRVVPVVHGL